jgi:precorrin-8X/cobalt-precorrin-8 methylmutase
MNIHFTEVSSLANIDGQIEDGRDDLSPAQYEIIRQVIYYTGDFQYYSLLKFAHDPLLQGFKALTTRSSIVVDVPEIQVSIVPRLKHTFLNPVYCCATKGKQIDQTKTKAAFGLESLASDHFNGVFVIGQDQSTLTTFVELIKNQTINPSLAIVTAPSFVKQDLLQYFQYASIPTIYIDSSKGGTAVASAIVRSLISLAWRASQN